MLALAVTGACLLAILGPSQPAEPSDRALYAVWRDYVMLAKQLAPAPRYLALNRQTRTAGAEVVATSAPVESDAIPAERAPTRINEDKPSTVSEGSVEASRIRVTGTKGYVRQWLLRSSYASVRQHRRQIVMRSHRRGKPTYVHYYRNPGAPVYARYQIAGQGYGY